MRKRPSRPGWTPLVLAFAAIACGEEPLEPGRARLTSGLELDPFTVSPVVTRTVVEKRVGNQDPKKVAEKAGPLSSFSLGGGNPGRYEVTGFDDGGVARVRARSLELDPLGFAGTSLRLFVSRSATWARPPGEAPRALGEFPTNALVSSRYALFARGEGDRIAIDGYDFGAWLPIAPPDSIACGKSSCDVKSLAVVSESLTLAIGDDFGFWFDPIVGDSGTVERPTGLDSWGDVAGGKAIAAPDGSVYVVGGTRAAGPSAAVLVIAADGELGYATLSAARAGAAATWLTGRGLVVIGGGSTTSPGGELLAEGSNAFTALPLAPDTTSGAGVAAVDATHLLRVGGRNQGAPAATVNVDVGCAASCAPEPAGDSVDLERADAYAEAQGALVVGTAPTGETRAFRIAAGAAAELPLREPRSHATSLLAPTGHVLIAGGSPLAFELYLE